MSRKAWVVVGAFLGVGLGFGLRAVDRALTRPRHAEEADEIEAYLKSRDRDPVVRLHPAGVELDGETVARKPHAEPSELAELTRRLEARRRRWAAKHREMEFPGMLELCAASSTPYREARRVLEACARAGYLHIRLGSLVSASGTAGRDPGAPACDQLAVSTAPPGPNAARPSWENVRIAIVLLRARITLVAGRLRRELPARNGGQDWPALQRELREIKRRLPNKEEISVSAGEDVLLAAVLRALELAASSGFTVQLSTDQRVQSNQ